MPSKRILLRLRVSVLVAAVAVFVAVGLSLIPGPALLMEGTDDVIYDAVYKLRPHRQRPDVPIVLVEVDDASLVEASKAGDKSMHQQWPWPRALWGRMAAYFQEQGARCVVFDLHFTEEAIRDGDDDEFAEALDALSIPVVISGGVEEYRFIPPVKKPVILGDVKTSETSNYRTYMPHPRRGPSLALAGLRAAGLESKLPTDRAFRLLYHGPHRTAEGKSVYPAWAASRVYLAMFSNADALPPGTFKNKIVIIGSTAEGLGDLKLAPLDQYYPGVETHATAIDNLLSGERVRVVPYWARLLLAGVLSLVAATGVIVIKTLSWKVRTSLLCALGLILLCVLPATLVRQMIWLPPVLPMLALLGAIIFGLVWTYRIEDARAKALLKALGQCVSPHVAAQLADEPDRLNVGGEQRLMTVLFSDIAGFTDLTERLREGIEPVLNFYLAEMSQQAFAQDGTIDKYIGDAMMVFWNAPLDQGDHAVRACRAALAIAAHEKSLAKDFYRLGADSVHTRIGINTGPVIVGFFGSAQRLSYTAVGDAVNLAARLEPGNKIYGTQILVSQTTKELAEQSDPDLLFRKLDRLRVYGRDEPAEVYELLGDRATGGDNLVWLAERFNLAMGHYFSQNWHQAAAETDAILKRFPEDGPAKLLCERLGEFCITAPPAEWDGVYTAKSK